MRQSSTGYNSFYSVTESRDEMTTSALCLEPPGFILFLVSKRSCLVDTDFRRRVVTFFMGDLNEVYTARCLSGSE